MTRDDVIAVARKYFTSNYLYVTKTTGRYKNDNLPKPDYVPVRPNPKQSKSQYAQSLEKLPVSRQEPRFVDEKCYSIETVPISDKVKMYATKNPVNDIFSLDIYYGVGILGKPLLAQVANYLHFIGTERDSFEVFRNKLQTIGSILTFEANNTNFIVHITGFDGNLLETIALVSDFMQHPKADEKQLRQVVDEMRVVEKALRNSSDSLASVLIEHVIFGEASRFLRKPSLKEVRQMKGEDLLALFKEVQQYACQIHYCGNVPVKHVQKMAEHYFRLQDIVHPSGYPWTRPLVHYDEPCVFFLNKADVSQSIVYAYIKGNAVNDPETRCASKLFSEYFGGDMSSLMFQEIREFRSYAYRVNGRYHLPSMLSKHEPGYFQAMFSTQSDKTVDALTIFHNLIRQMPEKPERIPAIRQNIRNEVNNAFPPLRDISERLARMQKEGFDKDPNRMLLEYIDRMDMKDVMNFYREQIAGAPVIYAIVGNAKQIDLKQLAAFGKIVKVKINDIYR